MWTPFPERVFGVWYWAQCIRMASTRLFKSRTPLTAHTSNLLDLQCKAIFIFKIKKNFANLYICWSLNLRTDWSPLVKTIISYLGLNGYMHYLPHQICSAMKRLQLKDQSFLWNSFSSNSSTSLPPARWIRSAHWRCWWTMKPLFPTGAFWEISCMSGKLHKSKLDQDHPGPSSKKKRERGKYRSALGKTSYQLKIGWSIASEELKRTGKKTEWDNVLLLQCRIQFLVCLTASVKVADRKKTFILDLNSMGFVSGEQ